MTDTVRLTPDWAQRTALLTFDRPEALNAVNDAVLDDLEAALARLESDTEGRTVVLTGAGRAFVGGGDIGHMAALTPDEGERFVYRGQRLLRRLDRLPLVTIAAINGFAFGGGLEIALACDLRLGAESAELVSRAFIFSSARVRSHWALVSSPTTRHSSRDAETVSGRSRGHREGRAPGGSAAKLASPRREA